MSIVFPSVLEQRIYITNYLTAMYICLTEMNIYFFIKNSLFFINKCEDKKELRQR